MAKQIISNKVYESLQVPTYDNQNHPERYSMLTLLVE